MAEKKLSKEEIIEGFNQLRQEQRAIATKIAELESDKTEHGLVIDALKEVQSDRKCFRLIGGVLVERTVGEVLPALTKNQEQIASTVGMLNKTFVDKGKSLNEYREKHNITVRGEAPSGGSAIPSKKASNVNQSSGVLVANK